MHCYGRIVICILQLLPVRGAASGRPRLQGLVIQILLLPQQSKVPRRGLTLRPVSLPDSITSIFSVSPTGFHRSHVQSSLCWGNERAKDAWSFFFTGVRNDKNPEPNEIPKDLADVPLLSSRPPVATSPRIGCRLCFQDQVWKTYANVDGAVCNMRRHLTNDHLVLYEAYFRAEEVDHARREGKRPEQHTVEPFSLEGL